jgi:1-acyl-sn-glycerol-3-phosphate acyltransferase
MGNNIKAGVKFAIVMQVIVTHFIVNSPFLITVKYFPYKTKKILNKSTTILSKILLFVLGIRVEKKGEFVKEKNYFIVSNHMSYIDIPILSSIFNTSYVTSTDIRETPGLGQIAELAGCLYVNRKSRENITNEIGDIERALLAGLNVTVFLKRPLLTEKN